MSLRLIRVASLRTRRELALAFLLVEGVLHFIILYLYRTTSADKKTFTSTPHGNGARDLTLPRHIKLDSEQIQRQWTTVNDSEQRECYVRTAFSRARRAAMKAVPYVGCRTRKEQDKRALYTHKQLTKDPLMRIIIVMVSVDESGTGKARPALFFTRTNLSAGSPVILWSLFLNRIPCRTLKLIRNGRFEVVFELCFKVKRTVR